LNNTIFLGEYNLDQPPVPSVSVFRPSPTHGRSLVRWAFLAAFSAAVVVLGIASEATNGTLQRGSLFSLLGVCVVAPVLFYRNTKLFVTEEHFGFTNGLGAMKLIPRKLLASVEADRNFRFQSADGVTLLLVRPAVWRASQIRQLSTQLCVPFEISV
jgi:hypothetical protein